MQKSKIFALVVITFLLVWPLQAQKKSQPATKPKAAPTKPNDKKPTSPPKPTSEAEEKPEELPPPPKPHLKPSEPMGRIVLVPLDDRPAVAQFAQMIGAIADYEVIMPPKEMLGRFTTPGDTKKILEWLGVIDFTKYKSEANYKAPLPITGGIRSTVTPPRERIPLQDVFTNKDKEATRRFIGAIDYSKVDAMIVSIDMLAYGGLIASRAPETSLQQALDRLEFFRWFKREYPQIPIYAFNVLMRVAPTASKETRLWREDLARWAELMDRVPKTNDAKLAAELEQLKKKLDQQVIDDYLTARRRNLQINLAMIKLYEDRVIDNLIFLQDDAREFGLHRHDQLILRARLQALGFADDIPIYNGADEGSLSLVSRAVLDQQKQKIKVAVVYSSENSRKVIAPFEDHPLEFTVENQIKAAGGQVVQIGETPDYTLYVNAPNTNPSEFAMFSKNLVADLKAGKAVALADVLFPAPHHSGADERLITLLKTENLFDRLAAYAAWNTAGNTLGTTIPAANLRIFSRHLNDAPERAARANVAHLEFLLHRLAGDYLYHDIVRFEINNQLRKPPALPADEFTEEIYQRINKQTQGKLQPLIEKFFAENFQGRVYSLGTFNEQKRELKINSLKGLKIYLPWPRTFESTIEYRFDYTIN